MTLLSRYLVRQNLFLLFTVLLVGTGLYILTEMFERLDNFLESSSGVSMMLVYFGVKIPTIIAMILPAVYMIAVVVQMNFLERSRELVALEAGGVTPSAIVRFVLLYGLFWALAQFTFGQVFGVTGERIASRIWQEDVRGRIIEQAHIIGLWFTEQNRIIHIGLTYPVQQKGKDINVYTLDDTGIGIMEMIKAKDFVVESDGTWVLLGGKILKPAEYTATPFQRLELPIRQDLRAFQVSTHTGVKPTQLSLPELRDTIHRLEQAGSNVEGLRAAWHGKISYACSIIILGLLALAVSRATGNIYKSVVASLLIVFAYYGVNTICMSMGEKGLLNPALGAWFANGVFFCAGSAWLLWPTFLRRLHG